MCWAVLQYFSGVRICADPQISQRWEFRASGFSWACTQSYACRQVCLCMSQSHAAVMLSNGSCFILTNALWVGLFTQCEFWFKRNQDRPWERSFQQLLDRSNSDNSLGKGFLESSKPICVFIQGLLGCWFSRLLYLWGC